MSINKILLFTSLNNLYNCTLINIFFYLFFLTAFKGRKNSAGLVCRKNIIAEQDAQVIKLMKKAGAILLCITNVSELGLWCEASNHIYGRTNNPYDTRRIVGSSGDGCIISGMGGLIGVSSDLSGGLRLSAYFNGIYAHKPTYGTGLIYSYLIIYIIGDF